MKKQLLTATASLLMVTMTFGQQWLKFPSTSYKDRVNVHDLDVAGNQITVEALVSLFDTSCVSDGCNIISKHFSDQDCNYLFRPHRFEFTTDAMGYTIIDNPIPLCLDSVYHLAFTYDGNSAIYYVNGSPVNAIHWTGNLIQNNWTTAIGNISNMGFNEQLKGFIDELRIWNVARTQSELYSNMYDLPDPTSQTGLLAYYKFDGNYVNLQGNSAYDGTVVGTNSKYSINPAFRGTVSTYFCYPTVRIVENNNGPAFKIYPNPNDGVFKIAFDQPIIKSDIEVLDVLGVNILTVKVLNETTKEINLTNITSGIYFVRVRDGEIYHVKKITVVRE